MNGRNQVCQHALENGYELLTLYGLDTFTRPDGRKVEIDYAKATGADIASSFVEGQPPRLTGQPPAKPSLASQMEAAGRSKA